jgi:ABC-type cobalamin transport system ATPase subunit
VGEWLSLVALATRVLAAVPAVGEAAQVLLAAEQAAPLHIATVAQQADIQSASAT